ncbi:MAG: ATPase, T2SS/T4P/T4SS family, partial [Planctomycetota bacterium]|nr:ATPase, T2SS/T4P/T4SS family [Planctomycetota bacterium]
MADGAKTKGKRAAASSGRIRRPLGQLLKEGGLVDEAQIQKALKIQREKGGVLGDILVEQGFVTEGDMLFILGAQAGMENVDLDDLEIPKEVIDLVPHYVAESNGIIPVRVDDGTVVVALSDPLNVTALDDLRFILGCEVKGAVAREESIKKAIEKYYAEQRKESEESTRVLMESEDGVTILDDSEQKVDLNDLMRQAELPAVVKLLNLILLQAVKDRGSDIHLEPFENEYKVRYRIDGVLYEMKPPPRNLATAMASRVKVMAKLDIAETRLPQDGRIELVVEGRSIDLRVSTLPTMFGESIVMRVLDRANVALDLEKVGLRPADLEMTRKLIHQPHGVILVTGPTGSGKTTTLYAALNEMNTSNVKIITTEDPVEYDLPGVVQVHINEEIGVTYAKCLRSILRQDPDVILVGEVRDLETGQIAVEASLTGHLVLSTLHTNDAPSAITRLVDLGLEPFLISATLESVIAQRLVRKICPECRTEYRPGDEEIYELDLAPADVEDKIFYFGKGCEACNKVGYRGRTALFEIMLMTEKLRQLVMQDISVQELRKAAKESGMYTLRDAGLLLISDGVTTIEEVVR